MHSPVRTLHILAATHTLSLDAGSYTAQWITSYCFVFVVVNFEVWWQQIFTWTATASHARSCFRLYKSESSVIKMNSDMCIAPVSHSAHRRLVLMLYKQWFAPFVNSATFVAVRYMYTCCNTNVVTYVVVAMFVNVFLRHLWLLRHLRRVRLLHTNPPPVHSLR